MENINILVPQLSESISEATLIKWHKKIGDIVNEGENLVDIETDKIVMEIPSPKKGIIKNIIKKNGENVKTNEIIGIIKIFKKNEILKEKKNKISKIKLNSNIKENKFSLINKKKQENFKFEEKNKQKYNSKKIEYIPMSKIRIKIAERLLESQANNAILTTFNEVNMKPIIDLRNKYKEEFEKEYKIKLGFMPFFIKAVIQALKKYPIINASIENNNIIYHYYYDIGIAVSTKKGLIVPILKNADKLSISEIEKKINLFKINANNSKLSIDELIGGTFTISNGGIFGSLFSTPIINPPQSAILGIHTNKDRVIVESGKIVIRPMNYLALSYDHRIIDGKEAILSLLTIKKNLEDPLRMMLKI
ncbi:2-oxo acid dehydrogenase subunit E2 [Candidatus Zinderia endosymbiont of Aphrophora alni]|uniref:2-oxo acid dehydrogenase subunit E2 n=1 Tax=Candidatus Zinderia endosymbiont of Aphrophora alni TaxID=3077951 RepID=UPI0030D1C2D0